MTAPSLICFDCGVRHGVWQRPNPQANLTFGTCELCGRPGLVVEPETFGGLLDTWKDEGR